MSDQAQPTPTESAPAEQAPVSETGLHPSWDQTFNDAFESAGIPEMLRKPVIDKVAEKIRADEAAVQRQIEAARGTVPQDWQQFLTEARQANVDPQQLVASYNAFELLRQDPQAFHEQLTSDINKLVSEGKLTPRQGAQLQAGVDQSAADQVDIASLDPEARRIKELEDKLSDTEKWRRQEEARRQAEEDAIASEQQRVAEERWADNFFGQIDQALRADADFSPSLADEQYANQLKIAVARAAGAMLTPDSAVTEQDVIVAAIADLKRLGLQPKVPAPAAAPGLPPVQGGGSAMPGQPKAKLTADQREAMMLAEAARLAQNG